MKSCLLHDRWTRINCTYEDGEWGSFGEWGEVHSVTKTERIGLGLRNPDLSCSNGQFDGVVVTQTFFNNDNKFEYIVTEYDVEEYTEEQDGYRTGGEHIAIKGFQIRNEDGATLHTIALPAEYQSESSHHSVELLIISGKKYIAIEAYHNGMYHTLFYQVSELGTIKAPITIKGSMKVRPAVSRRGESVTVEIGEEAQPGCTMSVIGIDGHEVQRVKVAAGSTSTKLNTGALTSGAYIVTVTNGNTRREAAKIIVR